MGCDSGIKENKALASQPYLELNSKFKIPQYGFVYTKSKATKKPKKHAYQLLK